MPHFGSMFLNGYAILSPVQCFDLKNSIVNFEYFHN